MARGTGTGGKLNLLLLYRMAYGFDTKAIIKVTIKKILQLKQLPITLYTNLKSLYNCLIKLGATQKK